MSTSLAPDLPVTQWRDVIHMEPGVQLAAAGWIPARPRAIALICHGHAEHLGRYGHVVSALVADGYAVYGLDHRGHGRSSGMPALIRDFDRISDDLHVLGVHASHRHQGLPIALIGHSMGGLIALRYALQFQDELAALITSGPALIIDEGIPAPVTMIGKTLGGIVPKVPMHRGHGDGCGLSTDRYVCEQFAIDHRNWHGESVTGRAAKYEDSANTRLGTAGAMLIAAEDTRSRLGELRLPLLAMHGADDTITFPRGTELLHEAASSPDKTIILWEGRRHEIFNSPGRVEVIATMRRWLADRVLGREDTE